MTPKTEEVCKSPIPPGMNSPEMSSNRAIERPVWSSQGTLIKRQPVRHYIPKTQFYYSTSELYASANKTRQDYEADTRKFVAQSYGNNDSEARRAFSAPGGRRKTTSSKLPPLSSQNQTSRPVTENRQRIRPENVPWVSTPVPGMRTIPEYDLYRKDALQEKNNLYHVHSGLLPKYMGYVPGLKFRYGSTFGMLTYNAKEIGVGRSATWGGAVSLF
uniref:protein FAM166B-like n=1 Tax=Styela clava TaxID=7725 RepID=UPI00193AA25B|nr:protein FAM166B-like [Styela clava]